MKKIIPKSTSKRNRSKQTKASVNKASLQKLSNKKNNRLAKQGKLNTKQKLKNKKKVRDQEHSQKAQAAHDRKELAEAEAEAESEAEVSESEPEDDEEEIQYFQHLADANRFSTSSLESKTEDPRGKKRKKACDSEDEEEPYEQEVRSFSTNENEGGKMMLPIINKGKVISRMVPHNQTELPSTDTPFFKNGKGDDAADETRSGSDGEDVEEEEKPSAEDERQSEINFLASLNAAQKFAYCKKKLAENKQQIAALCQKLLEDPINNIKELKELRLLLGSQDPAVALSVRKYALVSMAEVFKDIVPGYRLRVPTQKERASKVKKETKTLWDYEASFLLNYRLYLEFLETMAKGKQIKDKSFLTKHKITNLEIPLAASKDLGRLCLKCLCEMLTSHSHFNYRNDIIVSIIPFADHRNPEYVKIACDAIEKIFDTDKAGDVTLEIVREIGRMVKKRKFDVEPPIVRTFLALKIKEVDLSGISRKAEKIMRKEKMKKFSRRERKRLKAQEALDKELLETKASENKKVKLRMHTDTIQAVFETYIRVLKKAPDSTLMPAVLEGLAKFAHLINIEYFDALFSSLNGLIESGTLSTRESLHCMQTAFTILSGQGSVLNIDPINFYKHFYNVMLPIGAADPDTTLATLLGCLEVMVTKRRRQMSQPRVAAFMKRITIVCLQQPAAGTVALLAQARRMLHLYKYLDMLYDSEAPGTGGYLQYLDDPEHCHASSTQLWELHLLRTHFDPLVQRFSSHLLQQAPLTGPAQLPADLARASPEELFTQLINKDSFHAIPEKSSRKKKRYNNLSPEFITYLKSISPDAAEIINGEDSDYSKKDTMKMDTS